MTPLDLLREELLKWKKALSKSYTSYERNEITLAEHETHRENLEPKIQEYKDAIETLQIFGR